MLIERYYGENKLPTADWNNSPWVDIILIHSHIILPDLQPDIRFTANQPLLLLLNVTADWNNSPWVDIILIHSQPAVTFTP